MVDLGRDQIHTSHETSKWRLEDDVLSPAGYTIHIRAPATDRYHTRHTFAVSASSLAPAGGTFNLRKFKGSGVNVPHRGQHNCGKQKNPHDVKDCKTE